MNVFIWNNVKKIKKTLLYEMFFIIGICCAISIIKFETSIMFISVQYIVLIISLSRILINLLSNIEIYLSLPIDLNEVIKKNTKFVMIKSFVITVIIQIILGYVKFYNVSLIIKIGIFQITLYNIAILISYTFLYIEKKYKFIYNIFNFALYSLIFILFIIANILEIIMSLFVFNFIIYIINNKVKKNKKTEKIFLNGVV